MVTFEGGFPFEENLLTVQQEDQDAWGEVEQVTLYANGVAIASDSIKPCEFSGGREHKVTMTCISMPQIIREM